MVQPIVQRRARRAPGGRARRAWFLLGLLAIAAAPLTLVPADAAPQDESPWPFSLVPSGAWRGTSPDADEMGGVVPVEFRVGGYRGLRVLTQTQPLSVAVDCDTRSPRSDGAPASAPSMGVLTYERLTDTYTFWWPRPEAWVGTCRKLIFELDDGTVHPVMVYFGVSDTLIVP